MPKKKKYTEDESIKGSDKVHHFVKKHLDTEDDTELEQGKETERELEKKEKKKAQSSRFVTEQLSEIYKNDDGSMPDMTNFQKHKKRKLLRAFFTFLFSVLFLGGVLLAGVLFFKSGENFEQKEVSIEISGQEKIASGEAAHYRIRYRNGQNVPVTKAKISLRYPQGFIFQESSIPSANDNHDEWTLGTLTSGQSGYIDIYGLLYSDLGTEQSFRAFLDYTPANFSSEFQAAAVAKVTVSDSPVVLSITGPGSTSKGKLVPIIFTLTPRDASSTLQNLALVIDPGEGLVKKSSSPEADNFGAWAWSFPTLKGEKSVNISAAFSLPPESKNYEFTAKIIGWSDASKQGSGFVLSEKKYTVSFDETTLSTDFLINGARDSLSVQPGDILDVKATIKNNFSSPISNIKTSVTFDAPSFQEKSILNWSKLQDKNNDSITGQQIGPDFRRGIISWDKTQIPGLGILAQNAELPLQFQIPLKSSLDTGLANFKENTIQATFEVQYEQGGKKQIFVGAPLTLTVNSDLSLEIKKEVQKTATGKDEFSFTWQLSNTFHELKNIEVTAEIFGDIAWKAEMLSSSAGTFNFDSQSKKIVWKIDTVPVAPNPITAKFSFVRNSYNPTQTQLVSKIQIKAKDSATGKDMIVIAGETPNSL